MPGHAFKLILLVGALLVFGHAGAPVAEGAESRIAQRPGWSVTPTSYRFDELSSRLEDAIKAHDMGLVTDASASGGAASRGIVIPGNRIVGVYRNDFARRMLAASIAAGIEAPIRFYVTENPDGTATLSYKTPSFVFAPYMEEGGVPLRDLAFELDAIFDKISKAAAAR